VRIFQSTDVLTNRVQSENFIEFLPKKIRRPDDIPPTPRGTVLHRHLPANCSDIFGLKKKKLFCWSFPTVSESWNGSCCHEGDTERCAVGGRKVCEIAGDKEIAQFVLQRALCLGCHDQMRLINFPNTQNQQSTSFFATFREFGREDKGKAVACGPSLVTLINEVRARATQPHLNTRNTTRGNEILKAEATRRNRKKLQTAIFFDRR
jgi:hypothetical protein